MGQCIAIIAALKEELKGIRRGIELKSQLTLNSFLHYQGTYRDREVVLALSGMGEENAREATKVLLDHFSPLALISIGIAGAVDPRLGIGDLVIGQKLVVHDSPNTAVLSDEGLVKIASTACHNLSLKAYTGDLITVGEVISTREKKREIFLQTNALAVEMESAFVGLEAAQRKCPFLVLRSISDTADYSFRVEVSEVTDNGELNPVKLLKYSLRHPIALWELGKMRTNMIKATHRLNRLVQELITLI
jgi:adenosylhomocysteine nucleosidase